MHGVDVVAVDDREILDVPVEPVTEARLAGTVAGGREPRFGYRRRPLRLEPPDDAALPARRRTGRSGRGGVRGRRRRVPARIVHRSRPRGERAGRAPAGGGDRAGSAPRRGSTSGRRSRPTPSISPARDLQHVGRHAGGGLGAPRVRSVRDPVRPHLQGAGPGRRPAGRLRRRPHPQPGPDREGARLRRRAARRPAGLHQDRPLPLPRRLRIVGGHHRRHGARGRPRAAAVRRGRRPPGDPRRSELRPARVRPDPGDRRSSPGIGLSTRRDRWSRRRSRFRTTRSSTDTTKTGYRSATPTARYSTCRAGSATTGS